MTLSELEAKIEAILFTMGETVGLDKIALATEQDEETCRRVIRNMMDKYIDSDRGIQIIELDGAYQMCTKPEMYETLIRVAHVPKKHWSSWCIKSSSFTYKIVLYKFINCMV